jgi:TldD protein
MRVIRFCSESEMLDRLTDFVGKFDGYTELRSHVNHMASVMTRGGSLVHNGASRTGGVSSRVWQDGRFGFASEPGDDADAIRSVLSRSRDAAGFLNKPGTASYELPESQPGFGHYDNHTAQTVLSPGERVDLVRSVDAHIAAHYPDLNNVDIRLDTLAMEKALVTSEGSETYSYVPRAYLRVVMSMEADDGIVELYESFGGFGDLEDHVLDPQAIAGQIEDLYAELKAKAGGIYCEAGEHDVILSPDVTGILAHEAIGHTCEADLVLEGSIAGPWLGREVASDKVTLVDCAGRGPDGDAPITIHVDDEGTPCQDVTIIEDGVLKAFLTNRETAGRLDLEMTGNARAFAFKDEPLVRMRNTMIAAGTDSLDEMIGAIDHGYLFSRPSNGQADLTSEFMFAVTSGREIRNGKLGRALRDTTTSGVAFDMLKTVTHVGTDLAWDGAGFCGKKQPMPVGTGGPSIKCRITVGGR